MSRTSLYSDQYRDALQLVAVLFADKTRKLGDVPYIFHLAAVSHITQAVADDDDVHVAALLHDVLEDIEPTIYDAARMRAEFGEKITVIVETVSHDERNYSKEESRHRYIAQLEAGPLEACIVSGADLLHNCKDMVYWAEREPQAVKGVFGAQGAALREWFYRERFRVITDRLGADHSLVRELAEVLPAVSRIHGV